MARKTAQAAAEQQQLDAVDAAQQATEQTALAVDEQRALAFHDAQLGDGLMLDADDLDDGLGSELDADDFKVATLMLNAKRTDKDGRRVPFDMLCNTVTEEIKSSVRAALIMLKKSNRYSEYNESEERTEVICSSQDRVTGITSDGRERVCEGCPDAQWHTVEEKGKTKRKRNCDVVYNVFGVDLDDEQLFVMRYKRSSLPVIKSHLSKFHIQRRVIAGKRENWPLFAFEVRISGKMASDKANYAVPVIERTAILPVELQAQCFETLRTLRALDAGKLAAIEDAAEQQGGGDSGSEPDTSFDTESFASGEGQDFVTSSPTSTSQAS